MHKMKKHVYPSCSKLSRGGGSSSSGSNNKIVSIPYFHSLCSSLKKGERLLSSKELTISGRITSLRKSGSKLYFYKLRKDFEEVQRMVSGRSDRDC